MEQRTLQIQAGHHPLHLMSPRKTLEEDFEQVIDRVSPHPACRTVCAAQDYTNCLHALNYKTKLSKAAWILRNVIGCVMFVCDQDIIEAGVNPKGSVPVGVTNDTTDLLTTPQGETLLKPTEGIKPVKEDNLLERHQPQRMVSSRTLLKLGAQCSKQT